MQAAILFLLNDHKMGQPFTGSDFRSQACRVSGFEKKIVNRVSNAVRDNNIMQVEL